MDVLFGGQNHVEKGGDLLHVEDAHHAHVGAARAGSDDIEQEKGQHISEIKL
jgi:hypothetical protein